MEATQTVRARGIETRRDGTEQGGRRGRSSRKAWRWGNLLGVDKGTGRERIALVVKTVDDKWMHTVGCVLLLAEVLLTEGPTPFVDFSQAIINGLQCYYFILFSAQILTTTNYCKDVSGQQSNVCSRGYLSVTQPPSVVHITLPSTLPCRPQCRRPTSHGCAHT